MVYALHQLATTYHKWPTELLFMDWRDFQINQLVGIIGNRADAKLSETVYDEFRKEYRRKYSLEQALGIPQLMDADVAFELLSKLFGSAADIER